MTSIVCAHVVLIVIGGLFGCTSIAVMRVTTAARAIATSGRRGARARNARSARLIGAPIVCYYSGLVAAKFLFPYATGAAASAAFRHWSDGRMA
jgi:hypothetical protein